MEFEKRKIYLLVTGLVLAFQQGTKYFKWLEMFSFLPSTFFFVNLACRNIVKVSFYIYAQAHGFEHSKDQVVSFLVKRSLFALCIAHRSQFEHSGDSTMQSYNV